MPFVNQNNDSCYPKGCNIKNIEISTDVLSVNGKTGHVILNAVDVNAIPNPETLVEGGYLRYEDGRYLLTDMPQISAAQFNSSTHVILV